MQCYLSIPKCPTIEIYKMLDNRYNFNYTYQPIPLFRVYANLYAVWHLNVPTTLLI